MIKKRGDELFHVMVRIGSFQLLLQVIGERTAAVFINHRNMLWESGANGGEMALAA
ncbi:hypothetical protein [Limosilactobacillus ingluviei]|uniref:hypothetical protein n=1 Tax=Limosilactobacillus ingluviei TaxID=148604 RepID=UPI0023F05954|nr:hypothetical protein [Limosilactobacillus ingluviei]